MRRKKTDSVHQTVGGQGGESILSNPKHVQSDAKMISMALRRWGLPPALKAKLISKIDAHLDLADDGRVIAALGKVLTTMEGQNQADDHLAEKNDRLDTGKPTERVSIDDERRAATRKMLAHPELRSALIAAAEREADGEADRAG